jgi:hypothetical protein
MRFHSRLRSASITAVVALALLVGLRAAPSITQQPPTNATVNARAAQPTITSLSVTSGAVGTPVTITGSGFAAVQGSGTVTFNGITATIASWSSLSIVTAVPTNATTGPVIVSQNGLVSAGSAFTVTGSGVPLNCSDVTTRCVPSEYATIAAANTAAVAGDIVWVSAGTYAEHITLNASGTSGNTITFLANGTVNMCGFTWSAKNYVRIIGFTMDMSKPGCSGTVMSGSGTSTGLEFWNDTIENTGANKAYNIDIGLGGTNRCDKCIWFGGTITNINQSGTSGIVGTLIAGDDQFFGYVNISAVCYVGIGPVGARDRFDNNNFSALVQCGGTHPDNFYIATNATEGYTFSVVESTFGIGTPTGNNNKFMHAQNQNTPDWSDNIQRFNVGTNIGSGVYSQYSTGSGSNMRERFYNNTWVLDDRAVNGSQACGVLERTLSAVCERRHDVRDRHVCLLRRQRHDDEDAGLQPDVPTRYDLHVFLSMERAAASAVERRSEVEQRRRERFHAAVVVWRAWNRRSAHHRDLLLGHNPERGVWHGQLLRAR